MISFFRKAKLLFSRDNLNLYTVKEFAHANKDLLIIVCDPKSDRMFATYKDKFVNGKIKSTDGKNRHVVKTVLTNCRFNTGIDSFLGSLAETLNLSIPKANDFYKFIDGALFNIAKSLKGKGSGSSPPKGSVPSPFVGEKSLKK